VASGAVVVAQGLFAALFPSDCRLCGAPLENISRIPVCRACLLAMKPIAGETCEICGDTLGVSSFSTASGNEALLTQTVNQCASCQDQRPHFAKAAAYGPYDGGLRDLVHLLKYDRVHQPPANWEPCSAKPSRSWIEGLNLFWWFRFLCMSRSATSGASIRRK